MGKTNIRIKSMQLNYFKGIQNLKVEFDQQESSIFGANGTGKTTLQDAFTWCLFGRNAQEQSDTKFSIKTYDENNVAIPNVDHSVEILLDVDGEEVLLKRVLQEKWQKIKGDTEKTFTGNKTIYFWNDVPLSQREYNAKISSILDENVFKLITDPLAFNNLHWEKQRQTLIAIVGEESNEDTAKGNKAFEALLSKLTNKSLDEYKKELAGKRKKLREQIQHLPARIDEVHQGKPEPQDYDAAFAKAKSLDAEYAEIESLIEDRNKANDAETAKRTELNNKLFQLKSQNQNIEFEIKTAIRNENANRKDPIAELSRTVEQVKSNLERAQRLLQDNSQEIISYTNRLDTTLQNLKATGVKWDKENAREFSFDEDAMVCPTCKRKLDPTNIEQEKSQMIEDFKADKKSAIDSINKEGISFKAEKERIEKTIAELTEKKNEYNANVVELQKDLEIHTDEYNAAKSKSTDEKLEAPESILLNRLSDHEVFQKNKAEIATTEEALKNRPSVNIDDLKEKKSVLQKEIDAVKAIINSKEQIKTADARIEELKASESKLSQEIANIEKQQFVVEDFETKKINAVQSKVNKLFKYVTFKMFNQLVDGTQTPYCEAIYKGVNWNDLNTAAKINCGIDVINALSNHYQITAPIFIDNRESVSKLIPTDSQIINLIVSPEDKKLRVI